MFGPRSLTSAESDVLMDRCSFPTLRIALRTMLGEDTLLIPQVNTPGTHSGKGKRHGKTLNSHKELLSTFLRAIRKTFHMDIPVNITGFEETRDRICFATPLNPSRLTDDELDETAERSNVHFLNARYCL